MPASFTSCWRLTQRNSDLSVLVFVDDDRLSVIGYRSSVTDKPSPSASYCYLTLENSKISVFVSVAGHRLPVVGHRSSPPSAFFWHRTQEDSNLGVLVLIHDGRTGGAPRKLFAGTRVSGWNPSCKPWDTSGDLWGSPSPTGRTSPWRLSASRCPSRRRSLCRILRAAFSTGEMT